MGCPPPSYLGEGGRKLNRNVTWFCLAQGGAPQQVLVKTAKNI